MLAISPLRIGNNDMESFSMGGAIGCDDDFPDFSSGNLLDSIDFDDLFIGIEGGDMLPDLEMDPELLAEFTLSGSTTTTTTTTTTTGGGEEYSDMNTSAVVSVGKVEDYSMRKEEEEEEDKVSGSGSGSGFGSGSGSIGSSSMRGEEIVSKREVSETTAKTLTKDGGKGRKSNTSTTHAKNSHGKRKVKVDWTPELHRRFVQAVEQLGVDKAVPSRILEIMGIDCLTRHNIASHLQKYRSHRKHLLAREAEAASWSQRRQMYSGGHGGGGGGGHGKREIMNPWVAPTMGFPPITQAPPPPPPPMHHHFRPLHVWGHPSVDQSLMHMWPKHLAHSPSPPPHQHHPPHTTWAPPPPPPLADPSYWHHPHHQRVPNGLTPGAPYFPPPLATTRFPTPPVPGIPPPRPPHHAMYKTDLGIGVSTRQSSASHPPFDFHPSTESVDAAIGDVLSKPWLPLPLGLKPPSLDGVMVELQRQGVPKIPPSSCSS